MKYPPHTHDCGRCGAARVTCTAQPIIEEDGKYCPFEAFPHEMICEDCWDLEQCEYCGEWLPADKLIPCYGDLYCKLCAEGEPGRLAKEYDSRASDSSPSSEQGGA